MSRSRKFDKYDRFIDGPNKKKSKANMKKKGDESLLKISSKDLLELIEVGQVYTINRKINALALEKSCKGFVGINIYTNENVFIPTSSISRVDDFTGILNSICIKVDSENKIESRTCVYDMSQVGSIYLFENYNKNKDLTLFGEYFLVYKGNVEELRKISEDVYKIALDILEHCVAFDLQVIVE